MKKYKAVVLIVEVNDVNNDIPSYFFVDDYKEVKKAADVKYFDSQKEAEQFFLEMIK